MEQVLTIKKGNADTFTETITGLSSLSGYTAKMFIKNAAGTAIATLTGSINSLTITYELVNETSKTITVGTYDFETLIWDTNDHVYSPSWGKFVVESTLNSDPS